MDRKKKATRRFFDVGGAMVVWVPNATGEQELGFACECFACGDPKCRCTGPWLKAHLVDSRIESAGVSDAGIELTYRDDPGGLPYPNEYVTLALSADTGEVTLVHPEAAGKRQEELLDLFRKALTPGAIEILGRRWRRQRAELCHFERRRGDLSHIERGDLVPWTDAFPDEEDLCFLAGDAWHVAMDSYCVTPGCTCRVLAIAFINLTRAGKPVELGAVFVDYRSLRIDRIQTIGASEAKLRSLVRELRSQVDLKPLLAERWPVMRKLGKELFGQPLEAEAKPEAHEAAAALGRNDPCPCGSGKKYKKCCG